VAETVTQGFDSRGRPPRAALHCRRRLRLAALLPGGRRRSRLPLLRRQRLHLPRQAGGRRLRGRRGRRRKLRSGVHRRLGVHRRPGLRPERLHVLLATACRAIRSA